MKRLFFITTFIACIILSISLTQVNALENDPVTVVSAPESGDTIDTAIDFTFGNTIQASIRDSSDIDFFKFTTSGKGLYSINYTIIGYYGTSISLYDSSGVLVRSGSIGVSEFLQGNSTYYLCVKGSYSAIGSPVSYTIQTSFLPDDYANEFTNPEELALDSEIHGSINYKGDIDLFQFTAPETEYVTIEGTTDPGIEVCLYSYSFYPADIWNGIALNDRHISARLEKGKTYYIAIGSEIYDCVGSYCFKVKGVNDDFGDDFGSASEIHIGDTIKGDIEYKDDSDYFYLETTEKGYYRIEFSGEYMLGQMYTDQLNEVGPQISQYGRENIPILLSLEADKKYYIKLQNPGMMNCRYVLSVTRLYDDYGNDMNSAEQISGDSQVTGSIEVLGDVDYFKFIPQITGSYLIQSTKHDDLYPAGYLFDSTGACLEKSNRDYDFTINHFLKKGQIYYLKICSELDYGGFEYNTGLYCFSISLKYEDDYEDDIGMDCQALQSGIILPGTISNEKDSDCFRFTPQSDGTYIIQGIDRGNDPVITSGYLYDNKGNLIASDNTGSFPNRNCFKISASLLANNIYYIIVEGFNSNFYMSRVGEYGVGVFPSSPPMPCKISIGGQSSIAIPLSGNRNSPYAAIVWDQNGNSIPNQPLDYKVTDTSGSSIQSVKINEYGTLAVESTAHAGTYVIEVRLKSNPSIYNTKLVSLIVTDNQPVKSLTLFTDKPSPQQSGTTVVLTAIADIPAEYQFIEQVNGLAWLPISPYTTSNTFYWNRSNAGTYGLGVRARALGTDAAMDMERTFSFVLNGASNGPVTSLSLTTDKASSQPAGTTITLTATADKEAEYQFFVLNPGGNWTAVNSFSTRNTYSWTPASAGTYGLGVRARAAGTSVIMDMDRTMNFVVTPASSGPVTSLNLTTDKASSQLAGTTITLTATADKAAEYQFFVLSPGGSWTAVNSFSTSNTYSWTPTSAGTYGLGVRARAAGTSVIMDMDRTMNFVVTPASSGPVTSLNLTTDKASSQPAGTNITLTATADKAAEYQFFVLSPGGSWTAVNSYSTSNTYSWTPTSAGTYGLGVRARAAGTSVIMDMDKTMNFVVTPASSGLVTSLNLTTDKASSQPAGTTITLTATADKTAEYQFFVLSPGGSWTAVNSYSTSNTYSWTPTSAGTYGIGVRARAAGTSVIMDMDRTMNFVVTPASSGPVTSLNLTTDKASSQPAGTTITLTATADKAAEYQFFVLSPGGSWTAVNSYSTSNTYSWTPTSAGTYGLGVRARAAGTSVIMDMDKTMNFVVTPASSGPVTSLNLTTDKASSQLAGTTITLTATADKAAEYQFFVLSPGGAWTAVTGFGTNNTYSWTPASAGVYGLGVRARAAGTSVIMDMDKTMNFVVTPAPSGPVTSLNLTTDKASSQPAGTTIILTATADKAAEYQFFILTPGGGWTAVTGFSTNNTYTWTPTTAGVYGLGVRARAAGTSVIMDMDKTMNFVVTSP